MISLTCIDALDYEPTIRAIKRTLECVPISKIYWFSDVNLEVTGIPVTWVKIKRFKKL
jgi:hypothetical protein